VQDLVIRFASVTETQTSNSSDIQRSPQDATSSQSTSSDNSTSVSSANLLSLGVREVSVTLNNSLGQRTQVHVAQPGSSKGSTSSSLVAGTLLAKSANR
jgi:hypothetical protein